MTRTEIGICTTQGDFYQFMAELQYDMNIFSDVFLKSEFCQRHFDTVYSPYQLEFPNALYELCQSEIKDKLKKVSKLFEADRCFAKDVGFLYRDLFLETSIPSAELADRIPYKDLLARFENDLDWFEEDHRGYKGVFEDVMNEYGLPHKHFDTQS